MPSTAASHMIFFIAAVVVSTAVAGTLITTTNNFTEDIEGWGTRLGEKFNTDIKIINDPAHMPYNSTNNTLTLYVMNVGSSMIGMDNSSLFVMINGTYYTNLTFVLPSGVTDWGPRTVATIVVGDVTLPDADYRLKVVVVPTGAEDTLEFKIG